MKELVGHCNECGKEIYCIDGFLNGIVERSTGTLLCFDCDESNHNNTKKSQKK